MSPAHGQHHGNPHGQASSFAASLMEGGLTPGEHLNSEHGLLFRDMRSMPMQCYEYVGSRLYAGFESGRPGSNRPQ